MLYLLVFNLECPDWLRNKREKKIQILVEPSADKNSAPLSRVWVDPTEPNISKKKKLNWKFCILHRTPIASLILVLNFKILSNFILRTTKFSIHTYVLIIK